MATKSHTYRFTHEGHEYTRTTKRTYTHAVLHYRTTAFVTTGTNYRLVPCAPYVAEVTYCGSYALALKASTKWVPKVYCKSVIVELAQP